MVHSPDAQTISGKMGFPECGNAILFGFRDYAYAVFSFFQTPRDLARRKSRRGSPCTHGGWSRQAADRLGEIAYAWKDGRVQSRMWSSRDYIERRPWFEFWKLLNSGGLQGGSQAAEAFLRTDERVAHSLADGLAVRIAMGSRDVAHEVALKFLKVRGKVPLPTLWTGWKPPTRKG